MKQFIWGSGNLYKIVINPKVCEITSFCLELDKESENSHTSASVVYM